MNSETHGKARAGESGNVFIIIMIGVVLFAALMITFSRSTRQGGENMNMKRAELAATDILSYMQKVERAVSRVQLKNVSESDLSFESALNAGYVNPSCTAAACRIFNSAGGNMDFMVVDTSWLAQLESGQPEFGQWVFTGANRVAGPAGAELGTAAADLLMILPWVDHNVCVALNKHLGVGAPGAAPPQDTVDMNFTHYTGNFAPAPEEILSTAVPAACMSSQAKGGHHLYYTLVPR